jgi:glyoxylase-like metal-dependent hydrolase (beta-lactamase superfamily II)
MELKVIHTGNFKLDGGAMFGVVPKTIWYRTNPADDNNLCTWAMRCLLVVENDQIVLIDNGIGQKQSEKFFSYYYLHGDHSLHRSLKNAGVSPAEVTDMFHTHLHFDHCGGGVVKKGEDQYELTFPNARYWSHEDHWQWATVPNAREKASFLSENILPIQQSGQLNLLTGSEGEFMNGMRYLTVDGHTEKQMLPIIDYKGHKVVFVADLLPSVGHIPLAYVMGYDTRPLLTLQEKEKFLNEAAVNGYILFLEHDPEYECCTLKQTDRGPRLDQTLKLSDL